MNITKSIYYFLACLVSDIVMPISMLMPRNRKIILFGAWWGNKYDDNSRALFEYTVKNRPDIKAFWLSSNKIVVDEVLSLGFPAIYSKSLKGIYMALRAGIVCYCTSNSDIGTNLIKYLGGCTIVNLWHGVVTKKIMYDDQITRGEIGFIEKINFAVEKFAIPKSYVACTSEIYYPIFESAFKTSKDKILNIGQARNDYFFKDDTNIYTERYAGKKVILYMPTHRQEGKKKMDMKNILDLPSMSILLEKYNAVLIIKKHYYHRDEPSIGDEFDNIIDMSSENPKTPVLLKAADILITDYSSCYNDYLLLNRPQIFYCFDIDDYLLNDREMYFDYYSNVPGPICRNNKELMNEIKDVLEGTDNYRDKRRRQLDFFYSKENQGVVAPRQLDIILNL